MSGQIEEVNEKRGGNDTVTTDEGIASGDTPAQTKTKPGASWKANEQHVLPKNNMPLVFAGLMLCVFLAALDQVSISREFFICPENLLRELPHVLADFPSTSILFAMACCMLGSILRLVSDYRSNCSTDHRLAAEKRKEL